MTQFRKNTYPRSHFLNFLEIIWRATSDPLSKFVFRKGIQISITNDIGACAQMCGCTCIIPHTRSAFYLSSVVLPYFSLRKVVHSEAIEKPRSTKLLSKVSKDFNTLTLHWLRTCLLPGWCNLVFCSLELKLKASELK